MLKKGIIDPAKVTRAALENAASVATMVLTTESVITVEIHCFEPNSAARKKSLRRAYEAVLVAGRKSRLNLYP